MRVIALLSVFLLGLSTAEAQTGYAPSYGAYGNNPFAQRFNSPQGHPYIQQPQQQRVAGPADVLRQGINELRSFLTSGNARNPGDVDRFVEQRIAPYFNFNHMIKSSLGPTWQRMTPADRNEAKSWLRQNFLSRLTEYIANYQASRVDVLNPQPGMNRGEMIVPVRVWRQNVPPMSLDFRFYQDKSGWRIFDVSANGQSAIIFYRGYINRMLRGQG